MSENIITKRTKMLNLYIDEVKLLTEKFLNKLTNISMFEENFNF